MGDAAKAATRSGLQKALAKCAEYDPLLFLLENLPFSGEGMEPLVLAALLKSLARLLSAKGALRLDFMQRGALTIAQVPSLSSDYQRCPCFPPRACLTPYHRLINDAGT